MKKIFVLFAAFVLLIPATFGPSLSHAGNYSTQAALVDKATITFRSFLSDPNMKWFKQNLCSAKALLIIPQLLKGAFIFGAEGGTGVLLAKDEHTGLWSQPAFYTLASASFGLQAGAESSSIILMIMTDKGMDALLSTSLKLGGDVSVAAGPYGAGAKAATVDVLAFARPKGVFGGISVEGSVITPRNTYNIQYYERNVRPVDIIIRRNVSNPHSDKIIKAVSAPCKPKKCQKLEPAPLISEEPVKE